MPAECEGDQGHNQKDEAAAVNADKYEQQHKRYGERQCVELVFGGQLQRAAADFAVEFAECGQ